MKLTFALGTRLPRVSLITTVNVFASLPLATALFLFTVFLWVMVRAPVLVTSINVSACGETFPWVS
ncbi:hypothetical protein AB7W75_11525 [Providencia huaxiensis]|uniref:hypothetical protein n=1 Tax=Providencia huaxiensis TaxID=2027290 RepID=UPI0034E51C79